MTKDSLESYRSKKIEIAELQNGLSNVMSGTLMIGNDTIMDYRSGYPVPQAVVGVDWDKVERTESRYEDRISLLKRECEEVEQFIESIPDSMTRRIFRMHYIDGMPQKEVAKAVNLEKSSICKKINKYLKLINEAAGRI